MSATNAPTQNFPTLSADHNEVINVESLCMNCMKNGMTKLLLTKIPFFRDVVISSFECEHCDFKNNEIQPAAVIQEKGVKLSLKITKPEDLNRQVVRSSTAKLSIPEVDFEIPGNSQKGSLTTVEGVIDRACTGLLQDQDRRRIENPELSMQIAMFVTRMRQLCDLEEPFTLILDDPSGNSHIENPHAPSPDPNMKVQQYIRTLEQDEFIGLNSSGAVGDSGGNVGVDPGTLELTGPSEVIQIPSNCPQCQASVAVRMKPVEIPYFKEVIIMAMTCDACGHKENEVKSGSGIEPKGHRITLRITCKEDLNRDVLKSETSSVSIPELEFDSVHGTLGGRFTTVEGLIRNIIDQLREKNPFVIGDSSERDEMTGKMRDFLAKLEAVANGEWFGVRMIVDDPAGNSYIQRLAEPSKEDSNLTMELYERTFEQNETLGLNDMNTENYRQHDTNKES